MKKRSRSGTDEPAAVLVYSTDPIPPPRCAGCRQTLELCQCSEALLKAPLKPVVRIEKKGRGGKSVTVVERLPAHESFLKELCGRLKRSLGTGGTSYVREGQGVIEIQGERREEVLCLLRES